MGYSIPGTAHRYYIWHIAKCEWGLLYKLNLFSVRYKYACSIEEKAGENIQEKNSYDRKQKWLSIR